MKSDQTPPSSEGFTLIEVTLAIAITAIALVGLMGLLPQGLKTLEAAGERAIEARIHQDILSEIMLTSWEKGKAGTPIDLLDGEIRRYDDQGIQLTDADNAKAIFTAKINILKKGSQLPVSVGGGASAGVNIPGDATESANLRLAIVEIAAITDPSFDFGNPVFIKSIKTFRSLITKMGQDYTK